MYLIFLNYNRIIRKTREYILRENLVLLIIISQFFFSDELNEHIISNILVTPLLNFL